MSFLITNVAYFVRICYFWTCSERGRPHRGRGRKLKCIHKSEDACSANGIVLCLAKDPFKCNMILSLDCPNFMCSCEHVLGLTFVLQWDSLHTWEFEKVLIRAMSDVNYLHCYSYRTDLGFVNVVKLLE